MAGRWGASSNPTPPPPSTGDVSGIVGRWYIDRDQTRWELSLRLKDGQLTGTMAREGEADTGERVCDATWDAPAGHLRFRAKEDDRTIWYVIDVADGVMTGRYASSVSHRLAPASWSAYNGHLAGWRSETFDGDLAPRVFDIHVGDGRHARVRIDRGPTDAAEFIGEFKTQALDSKQGSEGELPSESILVRRWDGEQIVFDVVNTEGRQRFSGIVTGRTIEGSIFAADRTNPLTDFRGVRADVLSYGLRAKTPAERTAWQERTRRALGRLMMAGNPAPLSSESTIVERPVVRSDVLAPGRDDNGNEWQQAYRLWDITLSHTLPNPYGLEPLVRRSHGLLAVPTTPAPAGGYKAVVSLNGHYGSAQGQFEPDNTHWYGDAYARRGYVVFAVDVSHRAPADGGYLYGDPLDGDDPDRGNHAHPPIAASGLDSDWVDDGERAWDAMRGVDFLISQSNVNPTSVTMTGLSMGAAVTEIASALDPRVTMVIPASAPPDMPMLGFHGNHTCFWWTHGNPLEYVDSSDYLALIAPRKVVLESGKWDWTYSSYGTPFTADKENAWRARIAYGDDAANFVHFLHPGGHDYRIGDISADNPDPEFIQVPEIAAPPNVHWRSIEWLTDERTVSLGKTLFDFLER